MLVMASQLYDYTPTELQKLLDESNSYADLFRKIGMCEHGDNYSTLKKVIKEYNLDLTKINRNRKQTNYNQLKSLHNFKTQSLEEILVENSSYTNGSNLKDRLFKENLKERKCERCGLIEWQGQPIPLQLHHKNGKHNDNTLENLEILCPNCHALTNNFAGKNVKNNKSKNKKRQKPKQCPVCRNNYIDTNSKMCMSCYKKEQRKPKVSKEELFKILEANTYTSAASILGVCRETVSKWHKYYIEEE